MSTANITVPTGSWLARTTSSPSPMPIRMRLRVTETNNTFTRSLPIGPYSSKSRPSPFRKTPRLDLVISISSTVTNDGGGDAGAFAVTFYLSAMQILDGPDTLLPGRRAVTSLAAGASSAGAANVTIPANTPIGTYQLLAKADGLDQIAEALENNNHVAAEHQDRRRSRRVVLDGPGHGRGGH